MLFLGLVVGAIALGSLANLPWWVSLAWSPWLLVDPRPARRSLAVWWLLLSIMSPLYHPYARLWLPLHGAGWIALGGVIARGVEWLRDRAEAPGDALVPAIRGHPRNAIRTSLAIACLLLALSVEIESGARPLPGSWFFESTTGFRDELSRIATTLPKAPGGRPVRLLARRPLAFYLLVYAGAPFVLEPGVGELRDSATVGDRALVDEAVLSNGLGPLSTKSSERAEVSWRERSDRELTLEPVTLLDINPAAAYGDRRQRIVHLWDLVFSNDARLPRVSGGR